MDDVTFNFCPSRNTSSWTRHWCNYIRTTLEEKIQLSVWRLSKLQIKINWFRRKTQPLYSNDCFRSRSYLLFCKNWYSMKGIHQTQHIVIYYKILYERSDMNVNWQYRNNWIVLTLFLYRWGWQSLKSPALGNSPR